MRIEYKQIKISFPMTINGIAKTKDEYAVVDGGTLATRESAA